MTDRIPLEQLTSDQLDALYERLEAAEDTESQRQLATAREALASATSRAARMEHATKEAAELRVRLDDAEAGITAAIRQRKTAEDRARRAEAALARVRDLRDDLGGITGARWIAAALDSILGEQPAPAPGTAVRRVHVTITNPDPHTANRAALSLVDWITAEFGHQVATDAREWDEPAPAEEQQ